MYWVRPYAYPPRAFGTYSVLWQPRPALRAILVPRGYRYERTNEHLVEGSTHTPNYDEPTRLRYERRIWVDEVFVRKTPCPRAGPRGRVAPVAGPLARAASCGASPSAGGAPGAPLGFDGKRLLPSRGARNTHTGELNG